MDRVAREAGVGKPTLYRYFPSKEALLMTCVQEAVSEIDRETMLVLQNTALSPQEKLSGVIAPVMRRLARLHPAALDEVRRCVPEAYELIDQNRSRIILRNITAIVREGKERGQVRPDLSGALLAHVLIGSISHLSQPDAQQDTGIPSDQLLPSVISLLWEGSLIRESPQQAPRQS